jgi:ATP-dependent helicase/nuclease subunit B
LSGLEAENLLSKDLGDLAVQLDRATQFTPIKPPRPMPPVDARPTTFSVTRIEKLIRDSYHVYARQILNLQPWDPIGQDVDAGLRGSLIHQALNQWSQALYHVPQSEHLHLLLLKGREVFAPFIDMPEVKRFWWPRFERMAREFIENDTALRSNIISTQTEIKGHFDFEVGGIPHLLTARADRIDILENGYLRIIDYKSGKVPSVKQVESGFAPQLSLEALIAKEGQFKGVNSAKLEDVMFIAVGDNKDGVKHTSLAKSCDLETEIANAKAGLLKLLADYQNPNTAYLPRHNMQSDKDVSDYDHLSRKLEWQLEGTSL